MKIETKKNEMTKKENEAIELITAAILERSILRCTEILESVNLKSWLNEDLEARNKTLANNFHHICSALQCVVKEFYYNKYEISGFMAFDFGELKDFNEVKTHNLSILKSAKKLINYIN